MSSSSKQTNTTGVFSRSHRTSPSSRTSRPTTSTSIAISTTCAGRSTNSCAARAGSYSARLVASKIATSDGRTSFDVKFDGNASGRVTIGAVGEHNVLNALAALGVGLSRFGVTVEHDYPHHPTEIRATLSAAPLAFPGRRIVVAFQPHLFSRTRDFAPEFGLALAKADQLFLADIYPAREKPIPGVTSQLIAESTTVAGRRPAWMGARPDLAQALAEFVIDGDLALTVGAGDVTKTGPELLALLGARE